MSDVHGPDGDAAVPQATLPTVGRSEVPLRMWLLTVVTGGIYGLFHHYRLNRELQEFGIEVDLAKVGLAVFPGIIIGIPFLVSVYRTGQRIATAQEASGLEPTSVGPMSVAGAIFAFLNVPYHQAEINRVWAAAAGS